MHLLEENALWGSVSEFVTEQIENAGETTSIKDFQ